MDIPVIDLAAVYHIGTLNPVDQGRNWGGKSLEGHHLSVSLCPSMWRKVARLKDYPLHALHRDGAGRFLDAAAASRMPKFRNMITEWGQREGLLAFRPAWITWDIAWDYKDNRKWKRHYFESLERALHDLESYQGMSREVWLTAGPDGKSALEEEVVLSGTDALTDAVGSEAGSLWRGWDYAAMLWAEQVAPETTGIVFDGIWWPGCDEWNPPRGCIFKEHVARWKSDLLVGIEPDDEALLASMPETTVIGSVRNSVLGGVILELKETRHGPTQRACYPGRDPRPAAGWS